MNGWGSQREVERIQTTQRERHAFLKVDADAMIERLNRMSAARETVNGRDDLIRVLLVQSRALIERLAAELRVPR